MNVLVVFCHPRRDSLTGAILDAFTSGLAEAGHAVEVADLHAEGFDPVMPLADEPDWNDGDKRYSPAVLAEQARIARNDAVVLLFPVWWWSMPAMLKGWIDRVWNNGWAYGKRNLAGKQGLVLGVAAAGAEMYARHGYDKAIAAQIDVGILAYCGLKHAPAHIFHDTLESGEHRAKLIAEARAMGRAYVRIA